MTATRILYVDDHWMSPYAMYTYVALKEKGLAFETRELALYRNEQKNLAFQEISLTGKIPTLQDGSFGLSESLAIVNYLEEKYAFPTFTRLLPADVDTRARARQLMDWLGSDFLLLRKERPTSTIFFKVDAAPMTGECQEEAQKLLRVATRFLADGRQCLFGEWSIADTAFALMLKRLVASRYDVPQYVAAYVDTQWKRPSVSEFVSHRRPERPAY